MKLHTIASGSKGNCYVVEYGKRFIILDAGAKISEIMQVVKYKPSAVIGAFITHQHLDHCSGIRPLIKAGIHVYIPQDVFDSQHLKKRYNIHILREGHMTKPRKHNDIRVLPFEVVHDVTNYGYLFKVGNKKIVYITDTSMIPVKFSGISTFIVECNFETDNLLASSLDERVKSRIAETHMSVEVLEQYVKDMDKDNLHNIVLAHISAERGHNKKMIRTIKQAANNSHVKVEIAQKGSVIRL